MIRWIALLLWPVAVVLYLCGSARADVDGSVPAPGSCPYPATGTFGAAFGEYDYACQFPIEENGARHTTLFGGGMWQVSMQAGVSFMFVNASVTATSPAGVLRGITYWACPDFSMAAAPNPPGAWKSALIPKSCKSIAPRPELLRDGMPQPPPGAPEPPPLPAEISPPDPTVPTPPAPLLPNQTNPGATSPFQPEEHH